MPELTTTVLTIPEALAKLAAEGGPDQIADHLLAGGHHGYRGESDHCPVAAYLRTVTGRPVVICTYNWNAGTEYGPTPRPVSVFIIQFDEGWHSALDAETAGGDEHA